MIEGGIRDSEEIIELNFPVFSKCLCIRGTTKGTLGIINYPTVLGGYTVNPGDLIVGDDDGLVVVRREECETVLQKTKKRVAMELEKEKALATGISSVEYNGFAPLFEAAGLVEE